MWKASFGSGGMGRVTEAGQASYNIDFKNDAPRTVTSADGKEFRFPTAFGAFSSDNMCLNKILGFAHNALWSDGGNH